MPKHAEARPADPADSARAAATKEALLAAAHDEFARYGVAGARVDRIARAAGVNKERIYGYFGSKEKLFDEVVKRALNDFARVTAGPGDGGPVGPEQYVGRLFDYYREHPDLLRLLMWESLHERTGDLPDQQWRVELCGSRVDALAEALGEPRSPRVAHTMLALKALAMMPLALPQIGALIGVDLDDPREAAAMREHLMAFARTALSDGSAGRS
ncbi:TetR/AcrR family transcriptional regulator [Actinomadura kijaniata]|uniref:TetR/AcrR family transcriptional regulator n=1 Tax=Actinomadura kijaniata TaxID=46161 RepID=UPI003F1A9AD4